MPDAIKLPQFLALLYADIFDYPLTWAEMGKWSINPAVVLQSKKSEQSCPVGLLCSTDGVYFYLKGRERISGLRITREKISCQKKELAKKLIEPLKKVPTIVAIFLTGTVAVENCDENDDIDLMIVTKAKTLWITRLLATIILDINKTRRKKGDIDYKNKLCLNLFLDENNLVIPENRRGIYLAHEVLNAEPVFDRKNIADDFLKENEWVKEALPNVSLNNSVNTFTPKDKNIVSRTVCFALFLLNPFAHFVQAKYMKNKTTSEIIANGYLGFHPEDNREAVEKAFITSVRRYLSKGSLALDNDPNSL